MLFANDVSVIDVALIVAAIAVVAAAWAFALVDLFRRHDLHGWPKAGWFLLVLLVPVLGAVIYLVYRPVQPSDVALLDDVAMRREERHAAHVTEALHKLADLHDRGKISDAEYEAQKSKLLGG